jgi:FkbM family methyltransferase
MAYKANEYKNLKPVVSQQNIKTRKKLNIKPYLLFPYYLIAMVFMKYIKIPVLKFVKHTKQIWYSHSHRGKMDMLNKNFTNIMQSVTSVKNDMTNQITQIKNQQRNLEKQIADLRQITGVKSNDLSQQIADFKSATDISSEVLAQHITDLNSTTNTCSNSITKTINQTYDNVKNHIESIQLNVASNHDKLDKNMSNIVSIIEHNAADSKNDIKSVKQDIEKTNRQIDATKQYFENNQVLYFNRFETTTREERGMCDMVSAPNFEERFKKLMSGLPAESAETVVKIIRRLQMIKDTTNKLDLFTEEEKTQLKKVRNLGKEILKVSDNLYAYKNYMLPINHFEASVFVYNHGIDKLNSTDTFKDKDILDVGGFIGDSVLMLAPLTTGKVHSFEATNENYNHMLKTIELNGIKNAVPVHTAVGDKPGEIELRFNGSASSQNEIMVKNPKYVEKCPVITIDDYVREHNLNVGLIKVDIEGAEQSFLRGAHETIRTQKPTLLISIYHNVDDFLDIKPMIESWNLGYKFKIFKPTLDSISGETLLICEQ